MIKNFECEIDPEFKLEVDTMELQGDKAIALSIFTEDENPEDNCVILSDSDVKELFKILKEHLGETD